MKLVAIEHRGLDYVFQLVESTNQIHVYKSTLPAYTLTKLKELNVWLCDCPGQRYHNHCWHETAVQTLLREPSVEEPWAKWAEDAEVMKSQH